MKSQSVLEGKGQHISGAILHDVGIDDAPVLLEEGLERFIRARGREAADENLPFVGVFRHAVLVAIHLDDRFRCIRHADGGGVRGLRDERKWTNEIWNLFRAITCSL